MAQQKAIKVLVLGATGYVGSNVYKALKKTQDVQVIGTSRHHHNYSSYEWYSPDWDFKEVIKDDDKINYYDFDAVVNCIGNSRPNDEDNEYEYIFEESKHFKNIKKLFIHPKRKNTLYIHLSSAAVYTGCDDFLEPLDEDAAKHNLDHDYGLYANRKKIVEQTILNSGLENFVIVRPFTLVNSLTNVVTNTFTSHLNNIFTNENRPTVTLYGNSFPTPDGTAVRDYVDIKVLLDFIRMRILSNELFKNSKFDRNSYFNTVNIGSGKGTTNLQQVMWIAKLKGVKDFNLKIGPVDKNPYSLVADTSRLESYVKTMVKFFNEC